MTIGEQLLYARKRLRLKQQVLAVMLGVSRRTITNWENGGKIPETKRQMVLDFIDNNKIDNEQTMETIKDRLIKFIRYNGLSMKKFEESVGFSNGYVNNISKGVGAEKLQKILYVYPELNQQWLLTGESEMLNVQKEMQSQGLECIGYMYKETRPRLPMAAALGSIKDYYRGSRKHECDEKPVIRQFSPYNFTMFVNTDSMAPYINTGDVIACAEISETIDYGHVYVIDTDSGALIRRVYMESKTSNRLKLISENPVYPDFSIDRSKVNGIYRVVGLLRVGI